MPEVAEVRRYVDALNEFVLGKYFEGIHVVSGRYYTNIPDNIENFCYNLPSKLIKIDCKGKFIYFQFENKWNIWNTLGLTGSWTMTPMEHNRLIFKFENNKNIYFNDIRNFGTLKFSNDQNALDKKLKSLGPDILIEPCSDELFYTKLQNNKNKTLPEFLMDQSIISGVGNYIKAESLYLAKLSPHRLAGSINFEEASRLNLAIHSIAKESYRTGGSTFKTYSDFYGETGNYSDRFMVYGKKKDLLGNLVKTETTKDKRTTHWVPSVQK